MRRHPIVHRLAGPALVLFGRRQPWHLGGVRPARGRRGEQVTDSMLGPRGIAGWLILPALGIVFAPFGLLVSIVRDILPAFGDDVWPLLVNPGSPIYHRLWVPIIIFELVADVLIVIGSIVVLVLFFRKSRHAPRVIVGWLAALLLVQIVDLVLTRQIPAVASQVEFDDYRDLLRSAVAAAIWIPYFLVSRRVKNTFIE
jgi:hypothetical protein